MTETIWESCRKQIHVFSFISIMFISIPRLRFGGRKSEKPMKELPNSLVTLLKRKLRPREAF